MKTQPIISTPPNPKGPVFGKNPHPSNIATKKQKTSDTKYYFFGTLLGILGGIGYTVMKGIKK